MWLHFCVTSNLSLEVDIKWHNVKEALIWRSWRLGMKLPGSHMEAVDPASHRLFLGPPWSTYVDQKKSTCLINGFKSQDGYWFWKRFRWRFCRNLVAQQRVPGEDMLWPVAHVRSFFFPRLVDRMHQKIGNSIELMNRNGTHAHTDVATHRAEGPTSRCFDSLHKAS